MSENRETADNIICLICEQDLENDSEAPVVVVKRGIDTLKSVSLERKDDRHKLLDGCEAIKVHVKCREKYTMKKGGKFTYKYTLPNVNALNFSPIKKKLRISSDSFSGFEKKCFICTRGGHNRKGHAGVLRTVTTPEFQEKLEVALKTLYDEDCKIILHRISCKDLVTENAQYHCTCYNRIMRTYLGITSNEGITGRPKINISSSMEIIYDYMDECDDKCFTLQELMDLIGK